MSSLLTPGSASAHSPEPPTSTTLPFYERIPPHVRYPGMILFFLIGSVCAQMILLRSAISDGGAQVEKDYYQRAIGWEEEQRARHLAAEEELVDIQLVDSPRGLELTLFKTSGHEPIEVDHGSIVLRRPHLSEDVAHYHIKDLIDPTRPGILTIPRHAASTPGLWDIVLSMEDTRGNRYLKSFRREW